VAHGARKRANPYILKKHSEIYIHESAKSYHPRSKEWLIASQLCCLGNFPVFGAFQVEIDWTRSLIYLAFLFKPIVYAYSSLSDAMLWLGSLRIKEVKSCLRMVFRHTLSYKFLLKLSQSTIEHFHRFVATDKDPDYHSSEISHLVFQFRETVCDRLADLVEAVTFNILKLFLPTEKLDSSGCFPAIPFPRFSFLLWHLPPHRAKWKNSHHSGKSIKKTIFGLLFSCYFFALSLRASWFARHPCGGALGEKRKTNSRFRWFLSKYPTYPNFFGVWLIF